MFVQDKNGRLVIDPVAGVAQGCPLSPPLFQLLMELILRDIRANRKDEISFSYLDDNNVFCQTVEKAIVL
jgi:hypothetical protein